MADRKLARKALAALLATNPTLYAVYDYENPNWGGATPIAMVWSLETRYAPELATICDDVYIHSYTLALYWERGATTEDDIDDLSTAIRALLADNASAADWVHMELSRDIPGALDYPIVEGTQYRRELMVIDIY